MKRLPSGEDLNLPICLRLAETYRALGGAELHDQDVSWANQGHSNLALTAKMDLGLFDGLRDAELCCECPVWVQAVYWLRVIRPFEFARKTLKLWFLAPTA